jgi:heavy metal efflux system protein
LSEARQNLGRALDEAERIDVIWAASQEVRKPMLFGELIIIIVYLPILTLTGVEGKMFTPMALTVLLALTGALILSFTFVPSAVAIFLSGRISHDENLITRGAKRIYDPTLRYALRHRELVAVAAAVVVAVSAVAATLMGREFIPTLDEGDAAIHTMRVPDMSLTQAIELQSILETTLKERFPQIDTIIGRVGTSEIATEPHPPSIGDNTLVMKPREQWPDPNVPKEDLVKEIEKEAGKLLGSNFEFSQPIRMRFNHLLSGVFSDVAVKIFGDDMDTLLRNAEDAANLVRKIPGASHVKVEQVSGLPILTVNLKRGEMARYGLNVAEVQDIVEIAVGGKSVGQVFEGDRRFDIVVRLPEKLRTDVEALKRIPLPLPRSETGAELVRIQSNSSEKFKQRSFVTLGSVADLGVVVGPNQISREDGKRRVVVTCNVRDRDLGSFVDEAQRTIKERLKLPAGYWITWGGEFEQLLSAAKRLEMVVPLALILILGLLYAAVGSLKYALLVFTGVPLALTGGIIGLWLRDIPLSISAAVGFIALSGVAVLNGLVMITFINKLREEGQPVDEAVTQGALTRLRPVLMTALVASLGFIPMAIASGTGAEVQKPLATVVIGGLISSTLLTLVVLPALYSLVERGSVFSDSDVPQMGCNANARSEE